MFGRKDPNIYLVTYDDKEYRVSYDAMLIINELKKEIHELKHKKRSAELELEALRPVIENPKYKPAMSNDCDECKFVVKNRWNGRVIGCRKDNLCGDFMPREE